MIISPEVQRLAEQCGLRVVMVSGKGQVLTLTDYVTDRFGMYKLVLDTTQAGDQAIAHCAVTPLGPLAGGWTFGVPPGDSRLAPDGFLTLWGDSDRNVFRSSHSLAETIRRARAWCRAFSHMLATGEFPDFQDDAEQEAGDVAA